MVTAKKKGAPIKANPEKCTGCVICELRCSLRFEKAFNPLKAAIQIRRVAAEDREFEIFFSDRCDNCGICVRYCPYDALIQEKRKKVG